MPENLLLASLPRGERERLGPFLSPVELEFSQVVIERDQPIRHLYFPSDAISSTIQEMEDGTSIETGLMGVEGLIGIQLWLGVDRTASRTLIQVPGRALRISAEDFKREVMNKPSPLNPLIARYIHAFMVMTSLVAACNRLHMVDQRLCRWLSLVHNRARRDEFLLSQEFIAQMLGVNRPTVSVAAKILQKTGLISYARGRMRIHNPEGLKEISCECLELMESEFDKIFDQPWRELLKDEERADR